MYNAGDVWMVDFSPAEGHEQDGIRPALIVSNDVFNNSPAELVTVLPITGTNRRIPAHVAVAAGDGGLTKASVVMCDQITTASYGRFKRKMGTLSPQTMTLVRDRLIIHLDL